MRRSLRAFLALAVLRTGGALDGSTGWSLAEALSEKVGGRASAAGAKPVLVASSSRLIAFLGLLVILSMVLGVGYNLLWRLFTCQSVDGLDKVVSLFYGSAVLFAPYLANQLKDALASFSGKA